MKDPDAPTALIILGETVTDSTVTLTYAVGCARGTAACVISTERDNRGPFDYVHSIDASHDDARVLDLLESAALEAWGRRPSASDLWFASFGAAQAVAA